MKLEWRERERFIHRTVSVKKKFFSFTVFMLVLLASFTTMMLFISFEVKAEDIPQPPTIGVITYGGWDADGEARNDNCYAQREYSITVTYNDPNGWNSLQTVQLFLGEYGGLPGTDRFTMTYTVATRNFNPVDAGPEPQWDCTSTYLSDVQEGFPTIDDITITWRFKAQWDAVEEWDLDIKATAYDGNFPEVSQIENPEFDVVTTLLTQLIECSDTTEFGGVDRVDAGGSTNIDFEIRYANDPGSSDPQSEVFIPDEEFATVEIHNSTGVLMGEPVISITDGDGTATIELPNEVGTDTYHLFLGMTDQDFPPENTVQTNLEETIITDRIKIIDLSANDERVNVGYNPALTVEAKYEYDLVWVVADSITVSGVSLPYQGDGGAFGGGVGSQPSATKVDYNTFTTATNDQYGLTVGNMDGKSVSIIWDQIQVNWKVNGGTDSVASGDTVTVSIDSVTYQYDSQSVSSYQYDIRETWNGTDNNTFRDDSTGSSFQFTSNSVAGWYNYTITAFQDVGGYGITAFTSNQTSNLISIPVKQTISLSYDANNNGVNYITWGANSSISAKTLAQKLNMANGQSIQRFDPSSGTWTGDLYVVNGVGNFVINRWDDLRIEVTQARSYSFTPDNRTATANKKTIDFNTDNKGWYYVTWTKDSSIAPADFASTLGISGMNIDIVLMDGTSSSPFYNAKWGFGDLTTIDPYDVLCFRGKTGYADIDFNTNDF